MADEQTDTTFEGESPPPAPIRKPRVAVLLAFLGIFVLLLALFRHVLFPFLMAIYIAYLVEPIVGRATRIRLLGIKWTRGPTIVTIYVLVLGGLAVLGWVGIAKLAKQVRSTAAAMTETLGETGHRATFELLPVPPTELPSGAEPPPGDDPKDEPATERGILIPKATRLTVKSMITENGRLVPRTSEYATLYPIRVTPDERTVSVLLEHVSGHKHSHRRPSGAADPAKEEYDAEPAQLKEAMDLRYADGDTDEKVAFADLERLAITAGEAATGFEYFVEREFISPIVENAADVGYDLEPTLARDWVALQGEALKEDLPEKIGKWAVRIAGSLVFSIYEFFLILMLTAFIVMDRKTIATFFRSLPPRKHRAAYDRLMTYVNDGLAGVIRGQLVICGVNGLLTYMGLLILGVPYALMLSCIAAVFSLIPVFGTILSSIPIVLIATTDGIDTGAMALGWIVLIHVLEANVFNPVIMGTHARMHPVIIIFALLAGEHAFGIWGALLAVPTMSLIQSSFRFYLHEIEGLPKDDESDGHTRWMKALWLKLRARLGRAPAEESTP